jgi:hypothetical protein
MAARTNPRDAAIVTPSAVEKDGGRDEEDSTPFLVTCSNALLASYPDQEEDSYPDQEEECVQQEIQFRKSAYGLLVRKFERVADKFMVAAVMAMRVDETNTAMAMAVASVPLANNPETQLACASPNLKRPRTCLAESGQMAAGTKPRDGAIVSPSSVENDGGRYEEDSEPSVVTTYSSALEASYPEQEVVQEEEAMRYNIPAGWKLLKLEPDC